MRCGILAVASGAAWIAVSLAAVGAAEPAPPAKRHPRPERSAAARAEAVRLLREAYRRPPAQWPAPHVDPGIEWREIGLVPEVVHPESNP